MLRKKLVFFIAFVSLSLIVFIIMTIIIIKKEEEEKLGKREILYDVSYRRWQSARAGTN